jgi:5-hydroxyisourate hydrolase
MAGRLTTHVLDTAQGCPAANLVIELWRVNFPAGDRTHLKTARTNASGRTDLPLLEDSAFISGVYELVFNVGAYFSGQALAQASPPFLDLVPVRFGIADDSAHYHVPLLVSPWSYSTYRGS